MKENNCFYQCYEVVCINSMVVRVKKKKPGANILYYVKNNQ